MDDLISRQAAVDVLDKHCGVVCQYSKKQRDVMCGACALGTAFDVIEQLPSAQPEHKIQFTDKNHAWIDGKQFISLRRFHEAVNEARADVPSAQPERKAGRWIDTGSGQECSECHEIQYGYDSGRFYCPNCGASMTKGGE